MGKILPPHVNKPNNIQNPIVMQSNGNIMASLINQHGHMLELAFNNGYQTFQKVTVDSQNFVEDGKYSNFARMEKGDEEKIEKLFIQPKNLFEAVDFSNLGVIDESEKFSLNLLKGKIIL